MLKTMIGLFIGCIIVFPVTMFIHNAIEYGKREGIVAKKEDRDE